MGRFRGVKSDKSTGKAQRVLDVAELQIRIRNDSTLGSNQEDMKVERIDCGLVDLGARKRDPKSVIQAGCSVQSVQTNVGDKATRSADADYGPITVAVVDYIPLGESIEPHAHWPLSQGSGDESTPQGKAPQDGPSL